MSSHSPHDVVQCKHLHRDEVHPVEEGGSSGDGGVGGDGLQHKGSGGDQDDRDALWDGWDRGWWWAERGRCIWACVVLTDPSLERKVVSFHQEQGAKDANVLPNNRQ